LFSFKKFNIIYILVFILFFCILFCIIEINQEKSTRKRLLKKEVYAITEFIKNSCSEESYERFCIESNLNAYLEDRKKNFSHIPSYLAGNKIELLEEVHPFNVGVDDKNYFKKKYDLPFHKYRKIFGINLFLEKYTTTGVLFRNNDKNYTFILGSMDQINMAKPIVKKSLIYLMSLLFILVIYIFKFKNRIDCPFFYQNRSRVTSQYLIYIITMSILLIYSKKIVPAYSIENVYPWILTKMNPFKIHEIIFYIALITGFLFFHIYRNKLEPKTSNSIKLLNKIKEYYSRK